LLLIGIVHIEMGSPQAQWSEILQPIAAGFVQSKLLEPDQTQAFVAHMAAWMTGAFAAGLYIQVLLALLLARAWQARLFNPGGFREEFYALRLHKLTGLIALPLVGITLVQGAAAPEMVRDLGVLCIPLCLLQGLAVANATAAAARLHRAWLVALYTVLLLAIPQAEILLALVGLADLFVDFRGRWRPTPGAGP
jgi:hypothetical protein